MPQAKCFISLRRLSDLAWSDCNNNFGKNTLNGTYVYRHKHTCIPYSTFTITKVQLHVSAINVGHLQVVHEALNDKLYLHVSGEFTVCGVGVGARSRFVFVEGVWIGSV